MFSSFRPISRALSNYSTNIRFWHDSLASFGRNFEFFSIMGLHFFIKPLLCPIIMSNDEVKGKGKQIEGKVREEVGKLTGNKTEQVKGKIQQVEGKVQEEIGKAKRKL